MSILRKIEAAIFLMAIPFVVFVSIPSEIILGNPNEARYTIADVGNIFLLSLLAYASFMTIYFFSNARLKWYYTLFISSLVVNLLLWRLLSSALWPHGHLFYIILALELFALILTLFIFRLVGASDLRKATVLIVALAFGWSPLQIYGMLSEFPAARAVEPDAKGAAEEGEVAENRRADAPDIYHIIFDGFGTPFLTGAIASGRNLSKELDGYTLFQHATSNYGRTDYSLRSSFQGKLFDAKKEKIWYKDSFTKGFVNSLNEAGYEIISFPFFKHYCGKFFKKCSSTEEIHENITKSTGFSLVMDLTFLNVIPYSISGYLQGADKAETRPVETWDYGYSITYQLKRLFGFEAGRPRQRFLNAYTMDTFDQLIEFERSAKSGGRYVLAHLMMPHGPYLHDSQCRYIGRGATVDDQFECALGVIRTLNDTLKSLGRFDSSYVIIHADHGEYYPSNCARWDEKFPFDPDMPPTPPNTTPPENVSSQQVACRASSLMLLHKPGQTDFEVSDAAVTLLDIAPTIAEFAGVGVDPSWEGYSILSQEDQIRSRPQVYYNTDNGSIVRMSYFAEFVRQGEKWEFTGRKIFREPDVAD